MGTRILFTTVTRDGNRYYDYWRENTLKRYFRLRWIRSYSFGLRFIKQNIPEIEILEYPTRQEFEETVAQGWDIVGFSFYMNETDRILEMVRHCRHKGIPEIWAGNYGALTREIQDHFDRIFTGYAEGSVAEALGCEIGPIRHPPLVNYIGNPIIGARLVVTGNLFTTRGCTLACKFCQTPVFSGKVEPVPLESIDEVLGYYKSLGIGEITILDENFGLLRDHADEVVDLLQRHGMYWQAMLRPDFVADRMAHLCRKGMKGILIGVENLNDENMRFADKREKADLVRAVVKEANSRNIFTVGYYIIGFETETRESIMADIRELATWRMDLTQLCILTPLPRTSLWHYLDTTYGIVDKEYRHYDAKHLVWNHPNLRPHGMKDILRESFRLTYPRGRYFSGLRKTHRWFAHHMGRTRAFFHIYKHLGRAATFDYGPWNQQRIGSRKPPALLPLGRLPGYSQISSRGDVGGGDRKADE